MAITKRVSERLVQQLRRYQPILNEARSRDISESDTVGIIRDMLADVLGYNKWSEITSEFAIRGTFVDLAVRVGAEIRFLIEAKAIGADLKDAHVKQAIDYGANQGVEWIILTNAARWRVYKILFQQPIDKSLVFEVDLLAASARDEAVLTCFGNISKEGFAPSSMAAFFQQQQATSRYSLGAVLLTDPMLAALRRELRRLWPAIKVDEGVLKATLENDVLKREIVDSDEAAQARELMRKAQRALAKQRSKTKEPPSPAAPEPLNPPQAAAATPPPETPTAP